MNNTFIAALPFSQRSPNSEIHLLGWNVPPSELINIPDHWLVYPEPEASVHYLLAILYMAFILLTVVGNGLVMWIFTTAKSLRTPSNLFIVNLAFCDFLMGIKMPIFVYNSFNRGPEAGHVACQIFGFIGSLSGIGAGMTNACIAYDRYSTISNPLEGRLTHTKGVLMVLCIWIYTMPWAILPLTEVWGRFVPEGFLTQCSFDYLMDTFDNKMFVAVLFTFSYAIPMTMIIYFYSQIVKHVVNHEAALKQQAKKMNVDSLRSNQDDSKQSTEIRIAKVAIVVCFLFVASWTPYAILALIGTFGNKSLLTPGITMIPGLCCKLVACLDPYVYALSHPRYRVELQKKLPWLAIKESIADDSRSTKTAETEKSSAETT